MSDPWASFQQGLMTGNRLGTQLRETRDARELGGVLQSGDRAAARDMAYGQGNLRAGEAIQQQLTDEQKAVAEQRTEALTSGVRYLLAVPEAQRPQAFAQMRSQLGTIFEPELLDGLASADMSDQSLQAFGAALGEEAQRMQLFQTRSGDIVGVNPASGEQRMVYDGPDPEPAAPAGYRWTAEGGLEAIPGGPADPRVVGQRAAAGRAPPRPRSSGGGSRPSGGSRPAAAAAPARKPWERF